MKSKKIIFLIIAAMLAGGVFLFKTKIASQNASTQDVYYCPMHPAYTSNRPGDCPICNMKLVKKEPSVGKTSQSQIKKQIAEGLMDDICIMHNCPKVHDGKPCPMLVVAKADEKVTCPICGTHVIEEPSTTKNKKILYWTDPMIPGYKSEGPGKSPMGMDLVPVYEENGAGVMTSQDVPSGYAPVLVTPQKQQLIGIKTAPAGQKKLTKIIRTVGTVAHDPELYQAQAEYIQSIQAFERAKQSAIPEVVDQSSRLVESTKIRLKHIGLSDDLIAEIATWKEPEHSLLIAQPGEPVWIYAKIYEYELPFIKVGQILKADSPARSGEIFEGKIRAIDPMVDAATRTTRIRAQLEDPKGFLKPDMYINVSIDIDFGEVLAIPEEAIFDTGTKKIVFVDKGQGLFEPRDVVVGAKTEGFYELKDGVAEGEVVVTSGNFLIDSESRLKAALEGMSSSSQGEEHHH